MRLSTIIIKRKIWLLAWAKKESARLRAINRQHDADVLDYVRLRVKLSGTMGKPARRLLGMFQDSVNLSHTGRWNTPTVEKLSALQETFGDRVIRIAKAEVGAAEYPLGSNRGTRINKYFNSYPGGVPGASGWCTFFCWWCWKMAGAKLENVKGIYMPSTTAVYQAAKRGHPHLRLVTSPKKGDWVCMEFDWQGILDHSGLFVRWLAPGVALTLDGNTSNKVAYRQRRRSVIKGFVRYVP